MSAAAQIQLAPPQIVRADVTEAIAAEVVRECGQRYSRSLRAIILTGSLARGESTMLPRGGSVRIAGDAEFLLVFRRRAMLPAPGDLSEIAHAISRSLLGKSITCPIHLAGVTPAYLRRLPAHIFSYELRAEGKVVMGEQDVLSAIPEFDPREIERADAWHLLSNRMIEWLEALAAASQGGQPDPGLFYATIKLWMDAATSLLVFLRAYEPGYQARAKRLATLATSRQLFALPFSLREFSAAVDVATAWKLMPDDASAQRMGWDFCEQARRHAGLLWCWEAKQLTGLDDGAAPLTFLRSSRLRSTPWRGWLRAARECQRLDMRQPRQRWLGLGRWGSPRQCIYAVAAECVLRAAEFGPWAADGLISQLRAAKLRQFLPLNEPLVHAGSWRQLVHELAWNYHDLVENTRA